ncbi:MAG: hypothetical protein WC152_06960, partial [Candidatus Izemoplasmatales bacterium]
MKFRFKTQKYQVDAVNAVIDVFKGQPFLHAEEYSRDLGVVAPNQVYRQMSVFEPTEDSDGDDDDIGFSNASIKITSD